MFKVIVAGCEPTRGSKFSACVDLYAGEDVVIGAGETKVVGLGVTIDEPKLIEAIVPLHREHWKKTGDFESFKNYFENYFLNSHYLQLNPRSSLRAKGLISHTGIIDLDYPDEIKMIIHNPLKAFKLSESFNKNDETWKLVDCEIKKGQKIGQITLIEHKGYLMGVETEAERTGGLGSTGE